MNKTSESKGASPSAPAAARATNGAPSPPAGEDTGRSGDLRSRTREAIASGGLSQARAAREIGISDSALSQWLAGTYAGDTAAVDAKVGRWLDSRARRAALARELPDGPQWADTPSGLSVLSALSYAQLAACVAVVHGEPGTGKTVACGRYAKDSPNVWLTTMTPSIEMLYACLRRVAAGCGLRPGASGGSARLEEELTARLRDTRGLLVVDEAQHLTTKALEGLRSLHDATGTGLALVGSDKLYDRLTGGSRCADFAQLFSRIGKRVRLPGATAADADALLSAWGIEGGDARKAARSIARQPGGLRGLDHALKLASVHSRSQTVKSTHIRSAWKDLGGAA